MRKRAHVPFPAGAVIKLPAHCLLYLLAALLLTGCYADLDWRKLASEEGRFAVLMPARSNVASRALGGGARMTLWTASARDTLFGVSYTDYPDQALLHLTEARDALVRNVSGTALQDRPDTGPRRGRTAGAEATASRMAIIRGGARTGSDSSVKPVMVYMRLHALGPRLYQLTIIAPPDALAEADMDMFFSSFEWH